ncbi:MAG: HAD-IA family hydrolase [Pseudoruegeria sp.]
MTQIRALVFDVDGTLAETEEVHRDAFNRAFHEAGLGWHWSIKDYRSLLETTGGKERMIRYRDSIGATAPTNDTIAELHFRKTQIYSETVLGGQLPLRDGVAELIEFARELGLKIAVATTTNRSNVEALCQACWQCSGDEVFDEIAAGDEVAQKKPAPDVFLLALERLGVAASEAIAFEDSLNGVHSARRSQLEVVVTPSMYTSHQDFSEATWVVENLRQGTLPVDLKERLSSRAL